MTKSSRWLETHMEMRLSQFPDSILVAPENTPENKNRQAQTNYGSTLGHDALVYLLIGSLVLAGWQITRLQWFKPGDDVGYWMGIAGGCLMLMLFLYPIRKHFRFTHGWGRVKGWFVVHMVLGIAGPLLILMHSNFQMGSLNGKIAMCSMLAVAASGVVGRFLFARMNRGLQTEKTTLQDLQRRAGFEQEEARSRLTFAPRAEKLLNEFARHEIQATPGWLTHARQVFWLPIWQKLLYARCVRHVRHALRSLAIKGNWKPEDARRRERHSRTLVRQYLNAVTRVAQYTAYSRLFSLWHVIHIPFVYLMVFSAIVHVIAVHAY